MISGLKVRSELSLPYATIARETGDQYPPDVIVELRTEALKVRDAHFREEAGEVGKNCLLFRPLDGLALLIRNGCEILINRDESISDLQVRLFLLGTAWGVLCHQRDLLPLHASAVLIDGRAIAFTAPTGTGKSTLTAALAICGYPLLADDVCVVEFGGNGQPMLHPLPAKGLKLARESAKTLGIPIGDHPIPIGSRGKYFVDVPSVDDSMGPVRLAAVYELRRNCGGNTTVTPLEGGALLSMVMTNVYRIEIANYIRALPLMFTQLSKLCSQIRGNQWRQPNDLEMLIERLPQLVQHIRDAQSPGQTD